MINRGSQTYEKTFIATSATYQQMQVYNVNFLLRIVLDTLLGKSHLFSNGSIGMFLYFLML